MLRVFLNVRILSPDGSIKEKGEAHDVPVSRMESIKTASDELFMRFAMWATPTITEEAARVEIRKAEEDLRIAQERVRRLKGGL